MLSGYWAFSLTFDSATMESTYLFDIHVQFKVKKCLLSFHLIAMPLVGQHTSQNMFDAFVKVDDVVMPHWRDILFSVSLDGARNMTSLDRGIVSLIGKAVSSDRTILQTWCASHHIDLL